MRPIQLRFGDCTATRTACSPEQTRLRPACTVPPDRLTRTAVVRLGTSWAVSVEEMGTQRLGARRCWGARSPRRPPARTRRDALCPRSAPAPTGRGAAGELGSLVEEVRARWSWSDHHRRRILETMRRDSPEYAVSMIRSPCRDAGGCRVMIAVFARSAKRGRHTWRPGARSHSRKTRAREDSPQCYGRGLPSRMNVAGASVSRHWRNPHDGGRQSVWR